MQDKFDILNELPSELQIKTVQDLSNPDLLNLSQASKYHLALFKPIDNVRKLLNHIVRGQYDAVQSILTDDINLMLKRGKVTDYSGREFENISAFEYALWALDKHMWIKMISCVLQNKDAKLIFKILIAQYNKVITDGVIYRLNGQTITEQHFDFENTLIKELQMQVDSLNAPGPMNWDAIDNQWQKGVGGAQKLLPMHIIYEYCSNERFYPVPKFTLQPNSSTQFYNWVIDKDEKWFSVDSKLSVDFAIFKGVDRAYAAGYARGRAPDASPCPQDLNAMMALCKIRTNDFIDLKSQLEDQMARDNHNQVPQI